MDDMSNRVRRNPLRIKHVDGFARSSEEVERIQNELQRKILGSLSGRKSPCSTCKSLKIESTAEVNHMTMELEIRSTTDCLDRGSICPDLHDKQIMAKKSIWDAPFSTTTDPNDVKYSGWLNELKDKNFEKMYLQEFNLDPNDKRPAFIDSESLPPKPPSKPINKDVPQLSADEIW